MADKLIGYLRKPGARWLIKAVASIKHYLIYVILTATVMITTGCQKFTETVTLLPSNAPFSITRNSNTSPYSGRVSPSTNRFVLHSSLDSKSSGTRVSTRGYKLITARAHDEGRERKVSP